MSIADGIALALALAISAYLVVALLWPEKFD